MPGETIKVTEVRDYNGSLQVGAVVVLIPEAGFSEVQHTLEGQDFPSLAFLRANKTNAIGACDIEIPVGGAVVTAAFIAPGAVSGGIRVHV